MFQDPSPKLGDTDNVLLFKIAQMLSEGAGSSGESVSLSSVATALGFTPLASNPRSAYASGTGPNVEFEGASLVNFSGTDPAITLSGSGTYLVTGRVKVDAEGLTLASQELILSIARVSPAPFIDLDNSITSIVLPDFSTETRTIGVFILPFLVYASVGASDQLQLAAALVASNSSAGNIRITEASIVAYRIA